LHTGDTFERDAPLYLGPAFPRAAMRSTYAFIGLGSIDAVSVARLEENDSVPIGDWPTQNGLALKGGQLTAHGWHFVGLKDGWPVSGESDATMAFIATKSAPGSRSAVGANTLPISGTFTVHAETSYQLHD